MAVYHPRMAKKYVVPVCRANIQCKYAMPVCRISILCNDGAQVCSKISHTSNTHRFCCTSMSDKYTAYVCCANIKIVHTRCTGTTHKYVMQVCRTCNMLYMLVPSAELMDYKVNFITRSGEVITRSGEVITRCSSDSSSRIFCKNTFEFNNYNVWDKTKIKIPFMNHVPVECCDWIKTTKMITYRQ